MVTAQPEGCYATAMPSPTARVTVVVAAGASPAALDLPAGQEFTVMHSAADPEELLPQCGKLAPCVLLVNERSLDSLTVEDFSCLAGVEQSVHIVVISDGADNEGLYRDFLRVRYSGIVRRDAPPGTLTAAIRSILSGEPWLPRRFLARALSELAPRRNGIHLTRRETDVLELLQQGLSNRQIAEALGISRETVRWYVRGLNAKLPGDVRKRAPEL